MQEVVALARENPLVAKDFRYPDRDQVFLLPPDMREWLAEGHLVWWLIDVLDAMDLSAFERTARLGAAGRAPYAPATLLGILMYGYAHGQRSSRQLERLCATDVAFRVLAGNASGSDAPDHATLARFRQRHERAVESLFTQVLLWCAQAGLGRLGMVAIDGTKIAANASKQANAGESALRDKLAAEVAKIMDEADATDAAEDELFGDDRGDELPASWAGRAGRKARIRAALKDLEAQQARDAEQAAAAQQPTEEQLQRAVDYQRMLTDPTVTAEQRLKIGKPGKGVDRVVIARAAVERQLRYAREREQVSMQRVAAAAAQGRKLPGRRPVPAEQHVHVRRAQARLDALLAQAQAQVPAPSPRAAAGKELMRNISDPDSRLMKTQHGWTQGYNCQLAVTDDQLILAVRATQDHHDSDQLVPMMTAAQHAADLIISHRLPATVTQVDNDETTETLGICVADAGYLTVDNLTVAGPDRLIALGKAHEQHRQARDNPAEGEPPVDAGPIARMGHRLRTAEGATIYKRRGVTVEPVNGHLKDRIGLRQFSRRGLPAAHAELTLAATVANLLKLYRAQSASAW